MKGTSINILIKDENCDNLIKQTIEFLEVVKKLKIDNKLNLVVKKENVKNTCCIVN